MAEFCLECLNKLENSSEKMTKADYILMTDICEGCASWKPCVVRARTRLEKYVWMLLHPGRNNDD